MLCPNPITFKKWKKLEQGYIMLTVPCGSCAACKESKRLDWAVRLREHAKYYPSCFVTLTYTDEHLPLGYNDIPIVVKKDLQNYFKRLRKEISQKIKYFAVGEYGTYTYRPHYHVMFFNVKSEDYKKIADTWNYGTAIFREFTMSRAMYIAKYHIIKTQYPVGATRPFMLCSKGIGAEYINRMKEYHSESLERCFYTLEGKKTKLPRYLKDKIYTPYQRSRIAEIMTESIDKADMEEFKRYSHKYGSKEYFQNLKTMITNRERKFKEKSQKSQL